MTTQRIITEQDIIAARRRVAAAIAAHEQMDFEDALLGSAGLTPDMVREWLNAIPHVHWCACKWRGNDPIACETCGLPLYWFDEQDEAASSSEEPTKGNQQ